MFSNQFYWFFGLWMFRYRFDVTCFWAKCLKNPHLPNRKIAQMQRVFFEKLWTSLTATHNIEQMNTYRVYFVPVVESSNEIKTKHMTTHRCHFEWSSFTNRIKLGPVFVDWASTIGSFTGGHIAVWQNLRYWLCQRRLLSDH